MDLPVIYLIIILAYSMLVFAFYLKNYTLMMLTCFLMFALCIYTFQNGIGIFAADELVVIMFSAVTFGIAAYVSIKSTLDMIVMNYG